MSDKKLTHYRKHAKSDHLGVADLEDLIEKGASLIFTIKHVKEELGVTVAGRRGDHFIAYFKENLKPLCLNMTNAKRIRNFAKDKSPFVENWNNIIVEFYIDESVRMKGELTGGVRIKTRQPKPVKKGKKTMSPVGFAAAKESIKKGTHTKDQITNSYVLTEEMANELKTLK